jgi:hypothetical protein
MDGRIGGTSGMLWRMWLTRRMAVTAFWVCFVSLPGIGWKSGLVLFCRIVSVLPSTC